MKSAGVLKDETYPEGFTVFTVLLSYGDSSYLGAFKGHLVLMI